MRTGRKRIAALVATMAVTAAGMVGVFASSAGAQTFDASAELIGITENVWRVELFGAVTCEGVGDPEITAVDVDGIPVTPVSQAVETPLSVLVTLPADAPAGEVTFTVSCTESPIETEAIEVYSWIAITKVVEGPVPADATFTVNTSCDGLIIMSEGWGDEVSAEQDPSPFSVDLEYGAAGGIAYVYTDFARTCEFTEPNTGGATSTTIDVPAGVFDSPIEYAGTVTNVFVAPVVVAAPTFTG